VGKDRPLVAAPRQKMGRAQQRFRHCTRSAQQFARIEFELDQRLHMCQGVAKQVAGALQGAEQIAEQRKITPLRAGKQQRRPPPGRRPGAE